MNVKISVSLPETLLRQLDARRRPRQLGRSAAVQQAILRWTEGGELVDLEYVEAYRRVPESADEIEAWSAAAAEAWGAPMVARSLGRKRGRRASR
jgi:Arc/MetJ-type ribon-helix-helix transcriptional regulator